ncbi:hypothetical protein BC832DRAFT_428540 [Gaertneriomyces semiglobifer]|nr:hypothetical protein BC832DRAFT_428540 [Gaertneriomyces semiglobifer]
MEFKERYTPLSECHDEHHLRIIVEWRSKDVDIPSLAKHLHDLYPFLEQNCTRVTGETHNPQMHCHVVTGTWNAQHKAHYRSGRTKLEYSVRRAGKQVSVSIDWPRDDNFKRRAFTPKTTCGPNPFPMSVSGGIRNSIPGTPSRTSVYAIRTDGQLSPYYI